MLRPRRAVTPLAPLLAAATLAACGGASCPTTLFPGGAEALAARRRLVSPVQTLRAEARVTQRGRDGRIRGTVFMMLERPDRVRFDAMTQMGPAAVLTSDGTSFALKDLRENRFLVGPSCPANVARLLGIPLSGEDVARFLLGDTPLLDDPDPAIRCNEDGRYLVALQDADGRRQEVELEVWEADRGAPPERQRLRLLRSERFHPDGRVEWRATFDDYEPVVDQATGGRVEIPKDIRFEHPEANADTRVKMRDVDLGVELPADAFRQSTPPGLTPEHVACE